jgi:hypothetical protein
MTYDVKFIKENIYTGGKQVKKKQIPLSYLTKRISVKVRGWEVDYNTYSSVPRSIYFTALLKSIPKNIKELGFEELIKLFNKNVIKPFVPIIDFQEMTFYKDGRVWFKRNKVDLF